MYYICTIVFLLLIYDKCCCDSDEFRQEAAKVVYWNPKYVKNMNIFTNRLNRHSPYLTSSNCTTLYLWENNVTVKIEFHSARTKQEIFSLEFKLCDMLKSSWASEWLKKYSNVPPRCPVLPGTYNFNNIELPPKNFPIPIPSGDFVMEEIYETTKTREKILDLKVNLRFKKNKNGK